MQGRKFNEIDSFPEGLPLSDRLRDPTRFKENRLCSVVVIFPLDKSSIFSVISRTEQLLTGERMTDLNEAAICCRPTTDRFDRFYKRSIE